MHSLYPLSLHLRPILHAHRDHLTVLLALAAGAMTMVTPPAASAQVARVIHSTIVSSPTSDVPGLPGTKFDDDFQIFGINASPNGQFWLLNHQATGGANSPDEFLLLGTSAGSTLLLHERGYAGIAANRPVQNIDSSMRINDSGQWVVAGDFDGDTATDDFVITGNTTGPLTLIAIETGAVDSIFGLGAGNAWDTLDSTAIDGSGRVIFRGSSMDGPAFTTATDEAIFSSTGQVLLREGVTVPTNQGGGATNFFTGADLDDIYVSSDGQRVLVRGDVAPLPNAGDDAIFVNGSVFLQESYSLASFGITGLPPERAGWLVGQVSFSGINGEDMAPNGDVYAFGRLRIPPVPPSTTSPDAPEGQDEWAVRNNQVIAWSGQPIVPDATETWDMLGTGSPFDDFDLLTGNRLGRWVLGGQTSLGRNVLVYQGRVVLIATGDGVDLDGNGQADDGVFFRAVEVQEGALTDTQLLVIAQLQDGAGQPAGSALLSITLPAICLNDSDVAGPNQSIGPDGALTADDIIVFLGWYFANDLRADLAGPNQSPNPDGAFTADDIIVFLGRYFAGC